MPAYITPLFVVLDLKDKLGVLHGTTAYFLVMSILLSSDWIYTALAMAAASLATIIFDMALVRHYDLSSLGIMFSLGLVSILGCYYFEKSLKV